MADPFSIVAGSIGVADVCIRLVHNVRHLQKNLASIDEDLGGLAGEIDDLRAICDTVETTYTAKLKDGWASDSDAIEQVAGEAQDLWVRLERMLENCDGIVAKLAGIVARIRGHSTASSAGKRDAFGKVMRKKMMESDLRSCRAQLKTYQDALHLILVTINYQDMNNSQDYNAKSFRDITDEIQKLDDSIQSQIADLRQSMNSTGSSSHYDVTALEALEELRESVAATALAIQSVSTNHHFDIPQSVSSIFTGREALLRELRQIFVPRRGTARDQRQQRFIIQGLGGSGKTQFCCKFAEDTRDSFWGVFWIDASTADRAKQTLGAIAETAGLEKNPKAVLHWLSNLEQTWLLIIDNADDEDVRLEEYFPKGDRGHVLVTTRNPTYRVHGNVGPRFYEFRGLELDAATRLLLKASDEPAPWNPACEELALTITEALGYLALAIIQAGAAIRDKLCTLKDYLDYYGRCWRRIRNAKLAATSLATEVVVYASWELCYGRLEQKCTEPALDALELLNLLGFFHWENISDKIFSRALRNPELERQQEQKDSVDRDATRGLQAATTWTGWVRQASVALITFLFNSGSRPVLPRLIQDIQRKGCVDDVEDRIRSALRELTHMSLIIRNDHSETYSMHPIVHRWARERPRMRLADQALWADLAGRVLAASILLPPLGTAASDDKYHISLLPHVEHVQMCREYTAEGLFMARRSGTTPISSWLTQLVPALAPDTDRMRMYAKFSLVYAKCGQWESAGRLLNEVVDLLYRYLGREHRRSRQATLFLATVHWHMGLAEKAAQLQKSVLDICLASLGPSHPDTLRAMSELGRTRWQQGQFTAAHELQEAVLRELTLRHHHHQPDHPDTLDAMDNLGLTVHKFWETHHLERAFRLHADAAAGMARVHGPDHERTLLAKENLCRVSVLLGGADRVGPAQGFMAEVLETRRTRLGREHPYTLLAMVNMAIVLSAAGRPAEGEALILQGLPVADRNLGPDHIGTLFGRHTLACIVAQQGRHAEAEELLLHVTDRQKRMGSHRGDYHPDRLGALVELARCCFLQGKVARAIDVCDEAIRGFDSISVVPHPIAIGLRTARARMKALINSGSSHHNENHNHSTTSDVTFPLILFRVCDSG